MPAAPVDSWATVAIPTQDPTVEATIAPSDAAPAPAGASRAATATATATATAVAAPPSEAADPVDDLPDDADAPPEDQEPPFDPGPAPEIVVEASEPPAPARSPRASRAPRAAASRGGSGTAAADGIQRYGEAVVREVLGATFLEEVEAPGRPGFGERG